MRAVASYLLPQSRSPFQTDLQIPQTIHWHARLHKILKQALSNYCNLITLLLLIATTTFFAHPFSSRAQTRSTLSIHFPSIPDFLRPPFIPHCSRVAKTNFSSTKFLAHLFSSLSNWSKCAVNYVVENYFGSR